MTAIYKNRKPSPVEYGSLGDGELSKTTIIKSAMGTFNRQFQLEHRTEGYKCAGSVAVYIPEQWAVTYPFDGARHGKIFETLEAAECYFSTHTTPIVEVRI